VWRPPRAAAARKAPPRLDSPPWTYRRPLHRHVQFACGNFDANHPIPADQPDVDPFYVLYNVKSQELTPSSPRPRPSPRPHPRRAEDRATTSAPAATPPPSTPPTQAIQPLLDEIAALPPEAPSSPTLIGKLQRIGVDAFFGYGEQQDFKDASKPIRLHPAGRPRPAVRRTTTCARRTRTTQIRSQLPRPRRQDAHPPPATHPRRPD